MADELKAGSPLWYVNRLEKQLNDRRQDLERYDNYYTGKHPLGFASEKFRKAFGDLFKEFADNWCDLVVDAVEERLNVEGFRYGGGAKGDTEAWRIWQANQLDAESQIGHTEALINGEASVLVWSDPKDEDTPAITVEHPLQMIVAFEAGSRRRLAAFKRWVDDDGYENGTLYRPDGLYKFRSDKKRHTVGSSWAPIGRWKQRDVPGEDWPLKNPLGVVPVVPLRNRPRLLKPGSSEIHRVMPLQDAVNKLLADMMVASELGAVKARWGIGVDIPRDPVTNQPIEDYKIAVGRLFTVKNKDAKLGEFDATDLSNFVNAIEMVVQHIASQTRTPPHYFYLRGEFPSGESIKSAETGLVAKAKRKMRHFGETWEEAMRLAFLVIGDEEKGRDRGSETIWGDPESRTEGEHVDALTKLKTLGVPNEKLWEDKGYSPQEIERIKQLRAAEAAEVKMAFDPFAPPAPSGNGGQPAPANAGAS